MAFIATFKDGYTRTIAIKTQTAALEYAKDLEVWFTHGYHPERILLNVMPKK
jgi:hypothetical protein